MLMEPIVIKGFLDEEPEKFGGGVTDRPGADIRPFLVIQGDNVQRPLP